jgi:hypothetical protein
LRCLPRSLIRLATLAVDGDETSEA